MASPIKGIQISWDLVKNLRGGISSSKKFAAIICQPRSDGCRSPNTIRWDLLRCDHATVRGRGSGSRVLIIRRLARVHQIMMLSIRCLSLDRAAPLVKLSRSTHQARTVKTLTVAISKAMHARTPLIKCITAPQDSVVSMVALQICRGNL